MKQVTEVARAVLSVGAKAICAVSALISLAVVLGFVSRRSELLDSSLTPRELALGGIVLLLLAVSVLVLEARRDRRIKGALAVLSVLCAAGGAVLVWVAFENGRSVEGSDKGQIAKTTHGHGRAWKIQKSHAPKPKHGNRKSRPAKDPVGSGAGAADIPTEEGEASTSTAPYSKCPCPNEPYEPYEPYEAPESSEWETYEPEEWGEEESWNEEWEEEEAWDEGWEEEPWEAEEDWGEEW